MHKLINYSALFYNTNIYIKKLIYKFYYKIFKDYKKILYNFILIIINYLIKIIYYKAIKKVS